ncbi:MAG TPA: hypothetical protein VN836_00515 [Verrucomicrobiae bacterium]|nr:hypothetical protein [Verrucomicrobiae bacterium]
MAKLSLDETRRVHECPIVLRDAQKQLPLTRSMSSASAGAKRQIPGSSWRQIFCLLLAAFGLLAPFQVRADMGSWSITQLAFANAQHPSINNAGEVVWAVQNSTGIVSSVRGQLSASGVSPHLANGGEVVYADTFGGPGMDLVSTTRGRLTQGGIIQLGFSDFGVNSNGEVVYCALTNGNWQVISTVRGQVTFDAVDHYNPCINDLGEIIWNQYGAAPNLISSTRGPVPGNYPFVLGLNNLEEICYDDDLVSSNLSTGPHIFSSLHGVIINDIEQFQWGGGINDAGTIVWTGPGNPLTPWIWNVFEATWVPAPVLTVVQTPGLALEWPTNASGYHVQYATNLLSPVVWQRFSGSPTTNAGNFYQIIGQPVGNAAFFRLSTGSP